MTPHLAFRIAEPSQVGEARRAAVRLATSLGLDDVASGRVAIAVTELGTNLSRHATGGRLLIAAHADGARAGLDVLSLDDGPGMADVDRCLADGYSTSSTPGTGLGAVQRLCDEFSVYSVFGKGTVIFGRVLQSQTRSGPSTPASRFVVGAVCLAAPGETVSGDGWSFHADGNRASVIVADGLGHGPVAAEASDAALAIFVRARPAARPTADARANRVRSTRRRRGRGWRISMPKPGSAVLRRRQHRRPIDFGHRRPLAASQHGTVGLRSGACRKCRTSGASTRSWSCTRTAS